MPTGDLTLRETGGTVSCQWMRQWRVSGPLEGYRRRGWIEWYVARVVDDERRAGERAPKGMILDPVGEPYLVPPLIHRVPGLPEQLPSVTCVARYVGWRAGLTIVWFQDEFAFPMAPDVLDHLEGIDFPTLAVTVEVD